MKNFLFVILGATILMGSCRFMGKRVRGNGNWTTQERSVSSFSSVEVNGAIDVHVVQGAQRPVKIEADENLMQYVEVYERGDRLVVETKSGYNLRPTQKMRITVTAPRYRKIDVSGACDVIGEGKLNNPDDLEIEVSGAGDIHMDLNAPRVRVDVSGSGNVFLQGETRDFVVGLSGAGKVRCFDLKTENTKLDISGAGDAEVYASVSLDASVSGAGSVKYKGNASNVSQHVSGAGSVRKEGD